jgi:cyclopropane-fatty-acyl-phospholipid synthase
MRQSKNLAESLFGSAGIHIDGRQSWDMTVRDERIYDRIIRHGSLGLGEAYMEGWWDCEALDQFFYRILNADLPNRYTMSARSALAYIGAWLSNMQNPQRAKSNVSHHYDIGNDLYKAMLDRRMVYSCAYWDHANSLDEAQEAKLEMVCRKLDLQAGQRILDIGCGWGSFALYAAERYGVKVVGITLSEKQLQLGKELCAGLPVELRLQDYREIREKFDHIVSIGMIEHVGHKNYRDFMHTVYQNLSDDGIFLLHTIGGNTSVRTIDPWINKYIFPNAVLPSANQLTAAMEGKFVLEDWHNLGPHYDVTLMAWFDNFNRHWNELKERYDPTFYRMWKYYLLSCAATFRARKNQVWQLVLTKKGLQPCYNRLRYIQLPHPAINKESVEEAK